MDFSCPLVLKTAGQIELCRLVDVAGFCPSLSYPNLWLPSRCAGKTFCSHFHPHRLLANNLCFLFKDIFEDRLEAWKNTWNNSSNKFSKHWRMETKEVGGSISPEKCSVYHRVLPQGPCSLPSPRPVETLQTSGAWSAEAAPHPGRAGPSTSCCGNGTSGIPAATSSPEKSQDSTLCHFTK